jgi:transmembrane protein TMEM260 (protein O-mannosyltransferase)
VAQRCGATGVPIVLVALITYCGLASPFIVDGDNAELATLGAVGGRSHPPGYPLYVLWLRAWSWLPATTPAHRAAFATALLGSAALLVIHAACRAWGVRPLAASIATALYGAAPIVVRYHSEAEVFALNHLVASFVLWFAAKNGPVREKWRAGTLGLVAGLGLSNHMTCALLAPVGILGIVRATRESRSKSAAVLLAVVGLAIGLLPYAYLWIADSAASWGTVSSWSDLIAIVLRQEYGGMAGFAPMGTAVPWIDNLWLLTQTVGRIWLWLPLVAGLVMLIIRIRRPLNDGESRWGWIALSISLMLAGPILVARFNVRLDYLGKYVCERFHMLPALLLVVPIAAAIDTITGRIHRLAGALPVFVFLIAAATALPYVGRAHSPAMEYGIQNLLRSLPNGSVVYVVPDDLCGGAMYMQIARVERPDVVVLCAAMLSLRWYRTQQSRRSIGVDIVPGGLSSALFKSGRSLFADPQLTNALMAYPHYPYGIVRRMLPSGSPLPAAKEIADINRNLFDHFDLAYAWPGPTDGYAALAHYRYAATWSAIARSLENSGDRDAAREAAELSARLSPRD